MQGYDPNNAQHLFDGAAWTKSYASTEGSTIGGQCLEVNFSRAADGIVGLRDSNHPDTILAFDAGEWAAAVKGVLAGGLRLPQ